MQQLWVKARVRDFKLVCSGKVTSGETTLDQDPKTSGCMGHLVPSGLNFKDRRHYEGRQHFPKLLEEWGEPSVFFQGVQDLGPISAQVT